MKISDIFQFFGVLMYFSYLSHCRYSSQHLAEAFSRRRSGVFIVEFWAYFCTLFWCFNYWLRASKFRLGNLGKHQKRLRVQCLFSAILECRNKTCLFHSRLFLEYSTGRKFIFKVFTVIETLFWRGKSIGWFSMKGKHWHLMG